MNYQTLLLLRILEALGLSKRDQLHFNGAKRKWAAASGYCVGSFDQRTGGRHIRIGGPAGTVSEYFNPAAFTATPAYQFGNAPRYIGSIRLPGALNFDMLAAKEIRFVDQYALNFKVEFFNAFNRVQLSGVNTTYNSAPNTFGYISPTNLNSPRSLQGSLRFAF